jgi:hypothetical protein
MSHETDERRIFPALLNEAERLLLDKLSTEAGVSKSEVIRTLIYKEYAHQQLLKREKPVGAAVR